MILRYSLIFNKGNLVPPRLPRFRLKSSKHKCNLPNPEFAHESLPPYYTVKPLNKVLGMLSTPLCALIPRSLVLLFIFVIVLEWGICSIPSPLFP